MTMSFIRAKHYHDLQGVGVDEWSEWLERWPNFSPQELASPDDKSVRISATLLDILQLIRFDFGRPMNITSAYRTKTHNKRVGGVPGSQHTLGRAVDIALQRSSDGPRIERLARKWGIVGIGRYPGRKFIHLDVRAGKSATWGKRW